MCDGSLLASHTPLSSSQQSFGDPTLRSGAVRLGKIPQDSLQVTWMEVVKVQVWSAVSEEIGPQPFLGEVPVTNDCGNFRLFHPRTMEYLSPSRASQPIEWPCLGQHIAIRLALNPSVRHLSINSVDGVVSADRSIGGFHRSTFPGRSLQAICADKRSVSLRWPDRSEISILTTCIGGFRCQTIGRFVNCQLHHARESV